MSKKADVWVSAVIYVGIAVTIITIVLAAGMPVINRMRDRNTIIETKDILYQLNDDIKQTIRDGPGAQRTPVIKISKGEFKIDLTEITWIIPNSKFKYSEIGELIQDGDLTILTSASQVSDEYSINLTLDYSIKKIKLESKIKTLSGQYNLLVMYSGVIEVPLNSGNKYYNVTINEIAA